MAKESLKTKKQVRKKAEKLPEVKPESGEKILTLEDLNKIAFELDVKKKLADLQEKEKIVHSWEDTKIKNDLKRISHERKRVEIDKIYAINRLIESITVDEEKTKIGTEPVFKNTYNDEEQKILKDKLFQIIKKV